MGSDDKLAMAYAAVSHTTTRVADGATIGLAGINRLVECGGIIAMAERRALAETLRWNDFHGRNGQPYTKLIHRAESRDEAIEATDALIAAVVAKCFSEIKP